MEAGRHRGGIPPPAAEDDGLREFFRFRDFPHFIEVYIAVCSCLRTPEDFTSLVLELGEDAAARRRKAMDGVHGALARSGGQARSRWLAALAALAGRRDVHGLVLGRVVRMLADAGVLPWADAARRFGAALSVGVPALAKASWAEGFLAAGSGGSGGGGLLLAHDRELLAVLGSWVASLSPEDFMAGAPVPGRDARGGLRRLKRDHVIATLSNGNVALLTNMAKSAGLPWDCILSAELFNHYKPDPEVYHGAARLLGLANEEVMMVAAHKDDLFAAKSCGLRTAFVARARERGPKAQSDVSPEPAFDFNASDFLDLARQLGG